MKLKIRQCGIECGFDHKTGLIIESQYWDNLPIKKPLKPMTTNKKSWLYFFGGIIWFIGTFMYLISSIFFNQGCIL